MSSGDSSIPDADPSKRAAMNRRVSLVPFPRASAVIGYAVLSLFLSLLLLEAFSFVLFRVIDGRKAREFTQISGKLHCRGLGNRDCRPRETIDFASASPAYDGVPHAEDMWRDFRAYDEIPSSPAPLLVWGYPPHHSEFVNDDDSSLGVVRRTIVTPRPCTGPALHIWIMGGSAVWGYFVSDQDTVASYLANSLAAKGACANVVNLGVNGYNTNQELTKLLLLLKHGHRPDVLVMLDGFNDAVTGVDEGSPESVMEFDPDPPSTPDHWPIVGGTNAARLLTAFVHRPAPGRARRFSSPASGPDLDARVRKTLDNYEENCQMVRSLAAAYGFRALFFWQPSLLYKYKPRLPFEEAARQYFGSGGRSEDFRAAYSEAERRATERGSFVFLGSMFDTVSDPLYLDDVHLGPEGNRMVGERIADEIRARALKSPVSVQGTASSIRAGARYRFACYRVDSSVRPTS